MRSLRILKQGGWYEIRTRVNNREPLFRLGTGAAATVPNKALALCSPGCSGRRNCGLSSRFGGCVLRMTG
ncbi:MAG: hypothetical protein LBG08_09090 [Spirochaetaceae bacterium]|nr:hypothetical protein [Spirochaetaceae bacterium]